MRRRPCGDRSISVRRSAGSGAIRSIRPRPQCAFRPAPYGANAASVTAWSSGQGDPTPSPGDINLTAAAIAAGRLLDIELLDHIVVGRDSWVSVRDRGV